MRKLVCDICGKELDKRYCYNKEGDSQYMYVEIRNSSKYNAEYDICNGCYENILNYLASIKNMPYIRVDVTGEMLEELKEKRINGVKQ